MSKSIIISNLTKKYRLYTKKSQYFADLLPRRICELFKINIGHDKWVLKDFNLEIVSGERVGIVGENGTGKSTLLKIISQYITPTKGSVKVHGKVHSLLNLGAGFLHNLNAFENIEIYFTYNNATLTDAIVKDIIEFAELDEYANQSLKTYSSGMFARFAFSVMTAIRPDILIIDEILGAGDAYFMGKCVNRLNYLTNDTGMTLLIVSHDMSSIQLLCSRVLWIHKGTIVADGMPLEVIQEYQTFMRKKENIRLLEKQRRIPTKSLAEISDSFRLLTFRFTSDVGKSNHEAKIYMINIKFNHILSETIQVGNSFDNDLLQSFYIVESIGKTGWSSAKKDQDGYYRNCLDDRSEYKQAPFILKLPKVLLNEIGNNPLSLEVEYKSSSGIHLDIFDDDYQNYKKIAFLPNTQNQVQKYSYEFVLDNLIQTQEQQENITQRDCVSVLQNQQTQFLKHDHVNYGSREISIEEVQILDQDNVNIRVLFSGKNYLVRLFFNSEVWIKNPVFVFCIYTSEGLCVSQFIVSSSEIGIEKIKGKGHIDFVLSNLYLGAKDYVASAAIFKKKNINKIEPEAYHVIDRSIFFKVEDADSSYERGICLQPYEVKLYA